MLTVDSANFISVTSDASNRKLIHLVLISFHFFHLISGFNVKFLVMCCINGETPDVILNAIINAVKMLNIKDKSTYRVIRRIQILVDHGRMVKVMLFLN